MFHSHSILKSTFPTPSTFPSQAIELYNPKWTLMSVCCVFVWRFGISFTYVIESIDSKLISVCLINDFLHFADLHIFIYGRAECASISLACTKVKLLILDSFNSCKLVHFYAIWLLSMYISSNGCGVVYGVAKWRLVYVY